MKNRDIDEIIKSIRISISKYEPSEEDKKKNLENFENGLEIIRNFIKNNEGTDKIIDNEIIYDEDKRLGYTIKEDEHPDTFNEYLDIIKDWL